MSLKELVITVFATLLAIAFIVAVIGLIMASAFGNIFGDQPDTTNSLEPSATKPAVTTVKPTISNTPTPTYDSGGPSPTYPADPGTTVTPTPVPDDGPKIISAELVGYGTDSSTYNRGSTAKGYIDVKNTGNTAIDEVKIDVTVSRKIPIIGIVSQNFEYIAEGQNIQPGETKRIEFDVDIPAEYKGISTAGDYTINGNVFIGDKSIGTFSLQIKVV
ncbi:hypothetical protein CUJ83_14120 [Methanocella sp. CWC-04]|uniref:Uncharacterized protein n=1 Tax=Methanooceanicella nereidis TaxID=2052831 RepID=A0AAP2RGD9_9EURY|nr:hypothetical protein [Methanocella sp. CWC-04]MCD1296135.1 hypothetical protein [Methanocella sp. CWC-04]